MAAMQRSSILLLAVALLGVFAAQATAETSGHGHKAPKCKSRYTQYPCPECNPNSQCLKTECIGAAEPGFATVVLKAKKCFGNTPITYIAVAYGKKNGPPVCADNRVYSSKSYSRSGGYSHPNSDVFKFKAKCGSTVKLYLQSSKLYNEDGGVYVRNDPCSSKCDKSKPCNTCGPYKVVIKCKNMCMFNTPPPGTPASSPPPKASTPPPGVAPTPVRMAVPPPQAASATPPPGVAPTPVRMGVPPPQVSSATPPPGVAPTPVRMGVPPPKAASAVPPPGVAPTPVRDAGVPPPKAAAAVPPPGVAPTPVRMGVPPPKAASAVPPPGVAPTPVRMGVPPPKAAASAVPPPGVAPTPVRMGVPPPKAAAAVPPPGVAPTPVRMGVPPPKAAAAVPPPGVAPTPVRMGVPPPKSSTPPPKAMMTPPPPTCPKGRYQTKCPDCIPETKGCITKKCSQYNAGYAKVTLNANKCFKQPVSYVAVGYDPQSEKNACATNKGNHSNDRFVFFAKCGSHVDLYLQDDDFSNANGPNVVPFANPCKKQCGDFNPCTLCGKYSIKIDCSCKTKCGGNCWKD